MRCLKRIQWVEDIESIEIGDLSFHHGDVPIFSGLSLIAKFSEAPFNAGW